MRLIDADAFDRALANHEFSAALNEAADKDGPFEDMPMYYSAQSFRDTMRCRPTIDAVQVVRCKDCEYYAIWQRTSGNLPDRRYNPSVCVRGTYAVHRDPDWYCAGAVRRYDEDGPV